jgi:hypothetical protein
MPHAIYPISAKLFCKHSQVTFMPCGVVFKDNYVKNRRMKHYAPCSLPRALYSMLFALGSLPFASYVGNT